MLWRRQSLSTSLPATTTICFSNEIVLFNLARAFLEHIAALAYQLRALEKAVTEFPRKAELKSLKDTIYITG